MADDSVSQMPSTRWPPSPRVQAPQNSRRSEMAISSGPLNADDDPNSIQIRIHESESDSGYKSEDRPASVRKLFVPPQTALGTGSVKKDTKAHQTGNNAMIVETETVATVPSVSVATSAQGSVKSTRNAASVRYKKKKIRPVLNLQGTSKADIFAAKVASAVGDQDSSDSDETFVYESNPREPPLSARFKPARSPSITSVSTMGRKPEDLPHSLRSNGSLGKKPDPRLLNNVYSGKGVPQLPGSPRYFNNRGAASAIGADGYEEGDGDDDLDDDETSVLLPSARRRMRTAKLQQRRLRRSILVTCMLVVALIIGFSLGVMYVAN